MERQPLELTIKQTKKQTILATYTDDIGEIVKTEKNIKIITKTLIFRIKKSTIGLIINKNKT